jgi:GNAT superfamily N-acetyltransferase
MEKTADLCLRRAGEEDCERLSAIAFTAKAHWGYDAAFMEACRAELTFDAGRVKAEHIVIAERGGAPAGFYSLLPGEAPGCGEVEDMFVLPAHMGKGIGRALMEDLIRAARTRGMTRLEVDADPHARAFYERMGFTGFTASPSASIPGRELPRLYRAL